MMASSLDRCHRQASSFHCESREEASQPAVQLEQVLDCEALEGKGMSVQGSDWFQTETARLERLLGSGSVGSSKATEISKKLSVLTAFMPGTDSDEEEELTKAEE